MWVVGATTATRATRPSPASGARRAGRTSSCPRPAWRRRGTRRRSWEKTAAAACLLPRAQGTVGRPGRQGQAGDFLSGPAKGPQASSGADGTGRRPLRPGTRSQARDRERRRMPLASCPSSRRSRPSTSPSRASSERIVDLAPRAARRRLAGSPAVERLEHEVVRVLGEGVVELDLDRRRRARSCARARASCVGVRVVARAPAASAPSRRRRRGRRQRRRRVAPAPAPAAARAAPALRRARGHADHVVSASEPPHDRARVAFPRSLRCFLRRLRVGRARSAGEREQRRRSRATAHHLNSASGVVNFAASGMIPVASTPSQSCTTCL